MATVTLESTASRTGPGSMTHTGITTLAVGEMFVVVQTNNFSSATISISGLGLTWTERAVPTTASGGVTHEGRVWTAEYNAAGSDGDITHTVGFLGALSTTSSRLFRVTSVNAFRQAVSETHNALSGVDWIGDTFPTPAIYDSTIIGVGIVPSGFTITWQDSLGATITEDAEITTDALVMGFSHKIPGDSGAQFQKSSTGAKALAALELTWGSYTPPATVSTRPRLRGGQVTYDYLRGGQRWH